MSRAIVRIAHVGDDHLDDLDDLGTYIKLFDHEAAAIAESRPHLILHGGDLHNRKSSIAVRAAAELRLFRLRQIAPVVLARGNHDILGDLLIYRRHKGRNGIRILEAPDVLHLNLGGILLAIQVLPWMTKAQVTARDPELAQAETDEKAKTLAQELAESLHDRTDAGIEVIVVGVGHLMIGGSTVGDGQILQGVGLELGAGDLLRSGAALWALGHIHQRQSWHDGRVYYTGSGQRINFGEPEDKGWTLHVLEHDPGNQGNARIVNQEFHHLPARRIERLEMDVFTVRQAIEAGPEGFVGPDGPHLEGARVRIRIPVTPGELAGLDLEAFEKVLLAAGASKVKLEPIVQHESRARAAGIEEDPSVWAQVQRWLELKRAAMAPAELEAISDKLILLEGGVR